MALSILRRIITDVVIVLFCQFRLQVVEAHWDQTKNMQILFNEEETLLYQQPDMVRKAVTHSFLKKMQWDFYNLTIFYRHLAST